MPTYAENKKAHFDYEFLERIEAGIELIGIEVKAIRSGKAALDGARVIIRGGEAYVLGLGISPYQPANTPESYDPLATRRLLLKKSEIHTLSKTESMKGLTLIPISLYNKGPKIKISIAVARGKKKFDKRETLKKRDTERDIRKNFKAR